MYERDADRVEIGQPAHVRFAAYPDLVAKGQVVRISPLMDEKMRVLPVWVEVENRDELLKDGMLARITLLPNHSDDEASSAVARLTPFDAARASDPHLTRTRHLSC